MQLSIIIVNWNCAGFTEQCIAGVRKYTAGLTYEILVVDNASSDNSIDVLSQIPDIKLIQSAENIGFAGANNLGFQQASGECILFLNPDTKLLDNAIGQLYLCLVSSASIGAVGCRLLNGDLSLQTSCIQPFPTIFNQLTDIEALKLGFPRLGMWGIRALFEEPGEVAPRVQVVSGACLMVKREAFTQAGLFSPEYFMYGEDLDLCYKVQQLGWQVAYVANARVIHYGGQSTKERKDTSFGDVAQREAVHKFLIKTRGKTYANAFRWAICLISILRLICLCAVRMLPFRRLKERYLARATRKWTRILRWSLGLEGWVEVIGRCPGNADAQESMS